MTNNDRSFYEADNEYLGELMNKSFAGSMIGMAIIMAGVVVWILSAMFESSSESSK